jgi:hypothetical protein
MRLYSTLDIAKSVRCALQDFTHVVLNRGYTTIKPVYFDTGLVADLPVFQFASWIPPTLQQLYKWHAKGGLLIVQDTHYATKNDVTVMVECPYSMDRINTCNDLNEVYGVIPMPVSWTTHEECIDARFPTTDVAHLIWDKARGQTFTVSELSAETGIPFTQLQYMKNCLAPSRVWFIEKRMRPEEKHFQQAWEWVEAGKISAHSVYHSGMKRHIEEMGKLGYLGIKKYHEYKIEEPDWRIIQKKRDEALIDLAAVRTLVESLPAHPVE